MQPIAVLTSLAITTSTLNTDGTKESVELPVNC